MRTSLMTTWPERAPGKTVISSAMRTAKESDFMSLTSSANPRDTASGSEETKGIFTLPACQRIRNKWLSQRSRQIDPILDETFYHLILKPTTSCKSWFLLGYRSARTGSILRSRSRQVFLEKRPRGGERYSSPPLGFQSVKVTTGATSTFPRCSSNSSRHRCKHSLPEHRRSGQDRRCSDPEPEVRLHPRRGQQGHRWHLRC